MASKIYATTVTDKTATRRQTHNDLQNKLNLLVGEIRLFEKGLKLLPHDLQPALAKYLLRTLCTDLCNEILNYVAVELNLNPTAEAFNADQRAKFVNELPPEYKTPLAPLAKSLGGQNVDDFLATVDGALAACSMILKKIDKKKDRVAVLAHKHTLLEELNRCEDEALVLHLGVLVIFTSATQCMLHCSGRHVAGVMAFLRQYLSDEQAAQLTSYHDLVTLMLGGGNEAERAKEELQEKMSAVKKIANEYKRPGQERA